MIQAKKISCIVELEGFPVDFNSITISESKDSPPVAQITFPANINVMNLLPKTIANVFYEIDSKYYLIFQGEYSGYSIAKTSDRQEVSLTFEGFTANWNSNYIVTTEVGVDGIAARSTLVLDYASSDNLIGGRRTFQITDDPFTPLNNFLTAMDALVKNEIPLGGGPTRPVSPPIIEPSSNSNDPNIAAMIEALLGKESSRKYGEHSRYYQLPGGEWTPKDPDDTPSGGFQYTQGTWGNYRGYKNAFEAPKEIQLEKVALDLKAALKEFKGDIRLVFMNHFLPLAAKGRWDRNKIFNPKKNTETPNQYADKVLKLYENILKGGDFKDLGSMPLITPTIVSSNFLAETIKLMLKSFNYQGRYFRNISKFIGLTEDNIFITQSDTIESLISSVSLRQNIARLSTDITVETTMEDMMRKVLNCFGYTFYYFAAPTYINGKMYIAGIGPDTSSFSPILCNAVFEDEISVLQGGRNFNTEPTRLIYYSNPLGIADKGSLFSLLRAVAVPPGILNTSMAEVDLANAELFKLTEEEKCRGIYKATVSRDTSPLSLLEYSYFSEAYDPSNSPDVKVLDTVLGGNPKLAENLGANLRKEKTPRVGVTTDDRLQAYNYYIAYNEFYKQRHINRTVTIVTPYSPYRLVGLPGLILTKEFPAIVGVLSQIQTTLSADGNNSQSLVFTSCRFQNVDSFDEAFGFMDDKYKDVIPWFSDFKYDSVGSNLYKNLMGNSTSSLFDWQTIMGGINTSNTHDLFTAAIKTLRASYQSSNKFEFITSITKRELMPKEIFDQTWKQSAQRSFKNELPTTAVETESAAVTPYVTERYNRVVSIF
jgi:hypothetical protein